MGVMTLFSTSFLQKGLFPHEGGSSFLLFSTKSTDVSYFSMKTCGYLLDMPCGDTYNDYPQHYVFMEKYGVVGWCEGVVCLTSPGRLTDIGLQLGKACYPCSR